MQCTLVKRPPSKIHRHTGAWETPLSVNAPRRKYPSPFSPAKRGIFSYIHWFSVIISSLNQTSQFDIKPQVWDESTVQCTQVKRAPNKIHRRTGACQTPLSEYAPRRKYPPLISLAIRGILSIGSPSSTVTFTSVNYKLRWIQNSMFELAKVQFPATQIQS